MSLKNNKSLGQHWLKDRFILDEIADEAKLEGIDTCLEIGPGLGTLTSSLLKCFEKVIAVEFDERLAANLPKSFPGKNLEVINGDILKINFDEIKTPYCVAGNIPYYITSPIIAKLLEAKNKPSRIALLIQKEVAERILADPGDNSYLSIFVQSKAEIEPGIVVERDLFTPPPKVDSATIILIPRQNSQLTDEELKFIKTGFNNPRKKLIKNLPIEKEKLLETFKKLEIGENARAEDLSVEDWHKLYSLTH